LPNRIIAPYSQICGTKVVRPIKNGVLALIQSAKKSLSKLTQNAEISQNSGFSGNSVVIPKNTTENSKLLPSQSQCAGFGRFSTGLGKSVEISDELIEKSKNLFTQPKSSFGGFSTGLGRVRF